MQINIPQKVEYVIEQLNQNGFEAYVVGGCVRDSLLNREPKDWDITTNATPLQVKNIFNKTIDTGIQHGTVIVMIDKEGFEVTTYRVDGKYSDNRRPDNVQFTNSLKEDLSRRDFTINALAYNHIEGIIDYFDGINDINNKIIRCVGNLDDRFNEDALRMLRACRFCSQLNFDLEYDVIYSMIKNSRLISNISKERIQSELNKILLSQNLNGLYHIIQSDLLDYIIPELTDCFGCEQNNPYHIYSVGLHILKSVEFIENHLHLKLAMLFHDIAKPQCKTLDENNRGHFYGHAALSSQIAQKILNRLRYDNYTIMKVRDLILYHDSEIADNKKSVKRWLNKIGEENFKDLIKVREADIKAQNLDYYQDRHEKYERINTILEEVLNTKECFSVKDLAINGNDLIQLGYKEGKEIGNKLKELLEIVLDNPESNKKDALLNLCQQI